MPDLDARQPHEFRLDPQWQPYCRCGLPPENAIHTDTGVKAPDTVTLAKADVEILMRFAVGHAEWRAVAGYGNGLTYGERELLERVSTAANLPVPAYDPGQPA